MFSEAMKSAKFWSPVQNTVSNLGPVLLVLLYWMSLDLLGGLQADHFQIGLLVVLLFYTHRITRGFLALMMPVILTGVIYDSMRYYADYLRGPIHVQEPYLFDRWLFGISTPQGILTPNEWFQMHLNPFLDFITGLAYLIFIVVFILSGMYFYYWLPYRLKRKEPDLRKMASLRAAGLSKMWGFFWLNALGYSTYYWYAAAPPWYVAQYGLGPARLDVAASAAGCTRFDELLGTHFFSSMYGRAADDFGAIPSLHVAYPLLTAYFAFKIRKLRAFSIFFYLLMCFSAVYLNHHYILDIFWGSAYALVIGWWMTRKLPSGSANPRYASH